MNLTRAVPFAITLFLAFAGISPAQQSDETIGFVITTVRALIVDSLADDARIVEDVEEGIVLDLLARADQHKYWFKVKAPSGDIGYVNKLLSQVVSRQMARAFEMETRPIFINVPAANVREMPTTSAKILYTFKIGHELFLQEFSEGWARVAWPDGKDYGIGWIREDLVSFTGPDPAYARRVHFINSNSLKPEIEEAIMDGKVLIGMTREMVKASWGQPRDINRTVTANRVHEQWVYGQSGPFLYFDNGELTALQD